MKRIVSVFLLFSVFLFLVLGVESSYARKHNEHYWLNTPRTVSFRFVDYPSYNQAVQASMNAWNAVKNNKGRNLVYLQRTEEFSDFEICFDSQLWGTVAHCEFYSNSGSISRISILLNDNEQWSITGATSSYDLQSVLTHELGHALGIAHCHEQGEEPCFSSTCSSNVMNRNIT